jgi:hypothetical protein
MSEYRSTLERIGRRVPMPEPAIARLLRRRERRLRVQRIATVAGALTIAVVGIGSAFLALRESRRTGPAGGASAPPSPSGDGIAGFVLPTLAVWVGIAVLGLTLLAIARLRARPGGPTEQRPRIHTRPEPGHGPATAERGGDEGGATDMDSKARLGSAGGVRLPEIRMDDGKVRRTNRWLTIVVIVLAAGLVALGTFVLVDRSGERAQAPPASTAATAIIPYTGGSVLNARVTFDGTRCAYTGPTEVAAGTQGVFRYTGAAGTGMTLVSVEDGTTWEALMQAAETVPASEPPAWATSGQSQVGSGTLRAGALGEGLYFVGCASSPNGTDRMFPAVMIRVIGG